MGLPLRFLLTGVLSLFVAVGWLLARPDVLATYHYNQYVIALTHLVVLGWICTVVMGSMYQLVPVALETRLHSERLARWQFVLHVVGVAGDCVARVLKSHGYQLRPQSLREGGVEDQVGAFQLLPARRG